MNLTEDQVWAMYVHYACLHNKYANTPVGEKFKLLRRKYWRMYETAYPFAS